MHRLLTLFGSFLFGLVLAGPVKGAVVYDFESANGGTYGFELTTSGLVTGTFAASELDFCTMGLDCTSLTLTTSSFILVTIGGSLDMLMNGPFEVGGTYNGQIGSSIGRIICGTTPEDCLAGTLTIRETIGTVPEPGMLALLGLGLGGLALTRRRKPFSSFGMMTSASATTVPVGPDPSFGLRGVDSRVSDEPSHTAGRHDRPHGREGRAGRAAAVQRWTPVRVA